MPKSPKETKAKGPAPAQGQAQAGAHQGSEKRREVRVPVDLWVEVDRDGELYFQRASNLSVGGVYFTQTIPLPLSTKVGLKFELPLNGAEVRCRGEIVTAKAFGMGVHFIGLAPADEAQLSQVVSELATRSVGRS